MKFSTMARNGMLSSAFSINAYGKFQNIMNGDRSLTDVLISGGIGGAFSGLNSVGRNFAATSLWSGRSILSGGISPSSQAYQVTSALVGVPRPCWCCGWAFSVAHQQAE
jgi:hypothetical protein